MTTDDRILSGASSESSLPPNKSSGDIGERTWTPEQFWEFAAAYLGEHEAKTSRTMIEDRGLVLIPAAEIERLRREDGEGPAVSDDVRDAVQAALEKAGVEFIPENGGGAGVRMKKRGKLKV